MEDDSPLEYIRSITKRVQRIDARMEDDVTQMCNLVFELPTAAYRNESTRNDLKVIILELETSSSLSPWRRGSDRAPRLQGFG